MGCDIHVGLERQPYNNDPDFWIPVSYYGALNASRDYVLFGHLAGVRGDGPPVVPPRGFPTDRRPPEHGYYYFVRDDLEDDFGREGEVSRSKAEEWVEKGWAEWFPAEEGDHLYQKYVSGPDWHTPSWMTRDEFEEALRRAAAEKKERWGDQPLAQLFAPEYLAFRDYLRRCEDAGQEARIFFYFDN